MKAQLIQWHADSGWNLPDPLPSAVNLILYFGPSDLLASGESYRFLRDKFPQAEIVGTSAGSQIHHDEVEDSMISAVLLDFNAVTVKGASLPTTSADDSYQIGRDLMDSLFSPDLSAVLILSDGLKINGTRLIAGMTETTGKSIPLFGGLAGDGGRFQKTLVGLNETPGVDKVVAVGLYGKTLRISQAAAGGWDPFGPQRTISSANGNVLYELDGKPALDLYKRYLGDEAEGLPGTALLFPLCIWHDEDHPEPQVRTVLSVDHEAKSMTFAGDIPPGWSAQLMRGSHERLIEGAASAAREARKTLADDCTDDTVALMVSCVGRRLLMGAKTGDEAEAVSDVLSTDTIKLGFYSYGEIAPRNYLGKCDLHNQTMTIALLGEAEPA